MRRRTLWAAGVAALAGSAGLAGHWWRSRSDAVGSTPDIWALRFDTPQGGDELALAPLRGHPLLLNFWATWCPPCVTELPLIDRFHREQRDRGWRVVGLAIDNRDPVRDFLARHPVGFPIGLAGAAGVELARGLGNVGGALPFTVVFDRQGKPLVRKLGIIRPEDLEAWSRQVG
ncbi:MAG: TlpA disulfide reductase family protein [Burkholderiaceae bacterium]